MYVTRKLATSPAVVNSPSVLLWLDTGQVRLLHHLSFQLTVHRLLVGLFCTLLSRGRPGGRAKSNKKTVLRTAERHEKRNSFGVFMSPGRRCEAVQRRFFGQTEIF